MNLTRPLFVAALALSCVTPRTPEAPEAQPNVLLISVDTLRADHLGCYGYERDTSPFLDRLAAEGVMYRDAVVNTHGTKPSHTSILSSLYQESHRVAYSGNPLDKIPEGLPMLQDVLGKEGYVTLGVTGGGNAGGKFGFAQGFDQFNDRSRNIRTGIRRLLRMISGHQESGSPIFAFFHTYQVHSPYFPPPDYESLFGEFESNFVPSSENLLASVGSAGEDLSELDLKHVVARYDAGIRYADDKLAELFGRLGEIGFLDDAIVIVTSDHGEEFGERGGLLHRGLLYDELLRVPLIFAGSRVHGATAHGPLASSVDVAPTILACAGIAIPPTMQGRPLLCVDGSQEPDRPAVSQYGRAKYSVRTAEWKYVESTNPPGAELYHLLEDPGERRNLASERPDLVRRFRRDLKAWKKAQQATVINRGADEAELSEEDVRQLEALGYLGDG